MKISFRRKSKAEWVTLFVMFMPFLFFVLMEFLHVPSLIKYTIDIGWIYLLACILKYRPKFPNAPSLKLAVIVSLFFFFALVSFLGNFQSPMYLLWGIRNNARFFVFFFSCIFFVSAQSVRNYLLFLDKVFWINFPIVLFQFFALGYDRDHLGGIFGVEKGCNGYLNIFLIIIIARSLLWYLYKKEKPSTCLTKIAISLITAVLAELKVFFVELIIIIAFLFLRTRFSARKLLITVVAGIGLVASMELLVTIFPQFVDWYRLENIWGAISSEKGYTASGDMNRTTALTIALTRFLPTAWDKIFGLGLGNCDYAAFSFLITPFYKAYGRLNYVWFSSSFLALETGLAGLAIYIGFYLYIYLAVSKMPRTNMESEMYGQLVRIMVIMCIVLIFYNSSLRSEAAFMMYYVLAIPFVRNKEAIRV